ncbi:MAG: hypothetical protein WBY53_08895 [Acidobacteriaceae bacterium]
MHERSGRFHSAQGRAASYLGILAGISDEVLDHGFGEVFGGDVVPALGDGLADAGDLLHACRVSVRVRTGSDGAAKHVTGLRPETTPAAGICQIVEANGDCRYMAVISHDENVLMVYIGQ